MFKMINSQVQDWSLITLVSNLRLQERHLA